MATEPASGASEDILRARLTAAAALAGLSVDVTAGQEWAVNEGVVRLGLGWLHDRGHHGTDAVALALLLMWESVRHAANQTEQRLRIAAMVRRDPALDPLLRAVVRMLSALDLAAAFPAFARPLRDALRRELSGDLRELPRALQLVAAAVLASTGARSGPVADEVMHELLRLGDSRVPGCDPIRRAGAPALADHDRLERLCALLIPAYQRLQRMDAAARGLGDAPPGADPDERLDQGNEHDPGLHTGAGEGEADSEQDAGDAAAGESTVARQGERAEAAEGADLFAAEQAGAVTKILASPLPAQGAWGDPPEQFEPTLDRDPDAHTSPRPPRGARGPASRFAPPPRDYRTELTAHAGEIEQLREVWQRVITEQVTLHRGWTRTPEPEGEMLDRDALVRAVTESVSGVRRPAAYRSRSRVRRPAHRAGSTDYILLIDRSASMQGAPAEAAATAALIVLEALAGVERDIRFLEAQWGMDIGLSVRTSLILFDAEAVVMKPLAGALTEHVRRSVFTEVQRPAGSTNDAAALGAAHAEFAAGRSAHDGRDRRRVALVMSDGGTNDAPAADRALLALRALGVSVFGLGVGSDDLTLRYAPDGIRIGRPAELSTALMTLIERSRLNLPHPAR